MFSGGAGLLPVLGFAPGDFMALRIIQAILVGITAFTVVMVLHAIAPRRILRIRAHGQHRILTPGRQPPDRPANAGPPLTPMSARVPSTRPRPGPG